MRALVMAAVLGALGCGAGEPQPPVEPSADAHLSDRPAGAPDALIGKCELRDTGEPCAGAAGEDRVFRALQAGDSVQIVTGPQGSGMFVLSLRTTGMHPGDPTDPASTDNPDVTITARRTDGTTLARYRGRPVFELDEASAELTAVGLFVVLEGSGSTLNGVAVDTAAEIRDRDGVFRWGEASFTAVQ